MAHQFPPAPAPAGTRRTRSDRQLRTPRRPLQRIALGLAAATAALGLVAGCTVDVPGSKNQQDTQAAARAAAITLAAADAGPINPRTPITVDVTDGTLTAVTVTRPEEGGKKVAGAIAPDGRSFATSEPLGYGATYEVDAHATGGDGAEVSKHFTVKTVTPNDTAYANPIPAPEFVADTGIGVGLPLTIQFRKPVTDRAAVQKALKVTTDPPQEGAWYWIDDENVHYRAEHYWKPGTKIYVEGTIYGLDLGGGVYGAEDVTAGYTVHDSWIAHADGATHQMTIEHNGQQVRTMPISLGSPENPSHNGPHVISEKTPVMTMDSCTYGVCQGQAGYYRETVYNDLRISNDGEFVHNAPWSEGSQGYANVSHGCVNLSGENSQWFYDTFGIGDVVDITNAGADPLPVWDVYGDWNVPWDEWKKGNA